MDSNEECCEVRVSEFGGLGTFASRNLRAGEVLFREAPFLVSRPAATTRPPPPRTPAPPTELIRAGLSSISIRPHALPHCIRLAETDTGGTLNGSEETFWFARAYAACCLRTRAQIQGLSGPGGGAAHAIVQVVRQEVFVLRDLDHELALIPSDELEGAILRYWANTFGREGLLHSRGSRFNHSCAPNCTSVDPGTKADGSARSAGTVEVAFLPLRPITEGEELTLSYLPSKLEAMGGVIRRRHLWLSRGFLCQCELCSQPQDFMRRVRCPDCASRKTQRRRQQRCRDLTPQQQLYVGYPPGGGNEGAGVIEEEAFADWWNQSALWVCRWCGWCSDPEDSTLRRREGALGAEVFTFVMSQIKGANLGDADARGTSKTREGGEASQNRDDAEMDQQRGAVLGMLQASVSMLGRRHWTTFCSLYMHLEQHLSLSRANSPRATTTQPNASEALDGAIRDLNGLWLWLDLSPLTSPSESFLFDVVCALAVEGLGRDRGDWDAALQLLSRVERWASVFAGSQKRLEFDDAVAACRRGISKSSSRPDG